jgi:DHA1 family solute carrier family 18 vesicular amine transporter 1/2
MYPNSIDYAISWFETSSGIGLSFGPAIGSILFAYGGYHMPFLVFFIILTVVILLAWKLFPDTIDMGRMINGNQSKGSYLKLFTNRRILFACLITGLNSLTYDFLNPILSDVMYQYYGITEGAVGWLFWVMGIGYVLSWQLTNITSKYISNRRLIFFALLLNAMSTMLLGPSNILHTDAVLGVTLVALIVSGMSSGHFTVFIYSEIVEPAVHELNIDDNIVNGLASGLSRTMFFTGQMAAYSVGGYYYDAFGFSLTIDSIAIITFAIAASYFIWCDKSAYGPPDFEKQADNSAYDIGRRLSLRELLI